MPRIWGVVAVKHSQPTSSTCQAKSSPSSHLVHHLRDGFTLLPFNFHRLIHDHLRLLMNRLQQYLASHP